MNSGVQCVELELNSHGKIDADASLDNHEEGNDYPRSERPRVSLSSLTDDAEHEVVEFVTALVIRDLPVAKLKFVSSIR